MKRVLSIFALCSLIASSHIIAAEELVIFQDATPAIADDVNQNFRVLDNKIVQLAQYLEPHNVSVDCNADGNSALRDLLNTSANKNLQIALTGSCFGPNQPITDRIVRIESSSAVPATITFDPALGNSRLFTLANSNVSIRNVTMTRINDEQTAIYAENTDLVLDRISVTTNTASSNPNASVSVRYNSNLTSIDSSYDGLQCVYADWGSIVNFKGTNNQLACTDFALLLQHNSHAGIDSQSIELGSIAGTSHALRAYDNSHVSFMNTELTAFGDLVFQDNSSSVVGGSSQVTLIGNIYLSGNSAFSSNHSTIDITGSVDSRNSKLQVPNFLYRELVDTRAMSLFLTDAILGGVFDAQQIVASNSDLLITNQATIDYLWSDSGSSIRLEEADVGTLVAHGSSVMVLYTSSVNNLNLSYGSDGWVWDIPASRIGSINLLNSGLAVIANVDDILLPTQLACQGLSSVQHDQYTAFDAADTNCLTTQQVSEKLASPTQ